jgi:hypothetical protein
VKLLGVLILSQKLNFHDKIHSSAIIARTKKTLILRTIYKNMMLFFEADIFKVKIYIIFCWVVM